MPFLHRHQSIRWSQVCRLRRRLQDGGVSKRQWITLLPCEAIRWWLETPKSILSLAFVTPSLINRHLIFAITGRARGGSQTWRIIRRRSRQTWLCRMLLWSGWPGLEFVYWMQWKRSLSGQSNPTTSCKVIMFVVFSMKQNLSQYLGNGIQIEKQRKPEIGRQIWQWCNRETLKSEDWVAFNSD